MITEDDTEDTETTFRTFLYDSPTWTGREQEEESITLREEKAAIQAGTTGLRTWYVNDSSNLVFAERGSGLLGGSQQKRYSCQLRWTSQSASGAPSASRPQYVIRSQAERTTSTSGTWSRDRIFIHTPIEARRRYHSYRHRAEGRWG
jgi:hypothetical protein